MTKLHVYAPCPFPSKWNNQHLLKDCGLVPYMLYKVYGYDATMVGVRNGEYPYLEQYLPGMDMQFYPDCRTDRELAQHQLSHLREHYRDMDVLVLNGPYTPYHTLLPEYRKLRPDGKVYLGLDANSFWMDRIDWRMPGLSALLDECDVIATSGRKMQQRLNHKWPRWKIEYIPNGFFNAGDRPITVRPEDKENVILTVGRIGTEQKANYLLLVAFALMHQQLPGWRLRLVGSVAPAFQSTIDDFFGAFPHLREFVTFTGLLEDKAQLYDEYRRAKIFALSSTFEGGAPNVVAEALMHGCYPITSDIDAALDITANGMLGRIFPLGDYEALARELIDVATKPRLLAAALPRIQSYARSTFDWELIIKRLHHMLFGA